MRIKNGSVFVCLFKVEKKANNRHIYLFVNSDFEAVSNEMSKIMIYLLINPTKIGKLLF